MVFSVGICAYNEEKTLPKILPFMIKELSKRDELIIAACGEATIDVANGFAKKDSRIKVIAEYKREGKAAAMNKIVAKAKHKIIIFTDGDVMPKEGAFHALVRHFVNKEVGLVSGRVMPSNTEKSLFTFFANFACNTIHELRRSGAHRLPTGYLFAVRKNLMEKLPKCLSEDYYTGAMVEKKGKRIEYEPEAIIYVRYPDNLKDYFIQKVRTHYGHLEVKKRYSLDFKQFRPRGFILKQIKGYKFKEKLLIGIYILIESVVWAKAWINFKLNKPSWERVESSKKI